MILKYESALRKTMMMMMMRSGGRKKRDFQNATQPDDERVVKEKRKEKKLESRDTLFGKEGVVAAAPGDCFFFDAGVPFFPIFSEGLFVARVCSKQL